MKWLLLACLLSASVAVAEGRWIVVGEGRDAAEIAIDADTVQRNGDVVTVWVRHNNVSDGDWFNGKRATQILRRVTYSCLAMTVRPLAMVQYAADGTVLASSASAGDVQPIVPDTVEEAAWHAVCQAHSASH